MLAPQVFLSSTCGSDMFTSHVLHVDQTCSQTCSTLGSDMLIKINNNHNINNNRYSCDGIDDRATAAASGTSGTIGYHCDWGMRTMRPRGSNVRRAPIQTRQWLSMMYPVIP